MTDLAEAIRTEHADSLLRAEGEPAPPEIHDIGIALMLESIKEDLRAIGVSYDNWFSERSLYQTEAYEKSMALLKERGYITEREGATWFVSTALGEEKDNVVVRSTGAPTYFASDIAYHWDKFCRRNFDRVIDIWGADHQGHVPRMKAAVAALGLDSERLEILIYQLVTLKRGGEVVRLSKRAGDIVTLREVVEEVGPDAARFNFVARAADSHMDFDLDLAKEQSAENPVYYVQYAHARICGILAQAAERGVDHADGDVQLLREEAELALIRKMLRLPELIETMAESLEPHPLPYYAMELATAFHDFYEKCRVLGEDMAITKARLKLVDAARTVLARSLDLMGMTAPERM
jgi:arginyl-tRNA synthetase